MVDQFGEEVFLGGVRRILAVYPSSFFCACSAAHNESAKIRQVTVLRMDDIISTGAGHATGAGPARRPAF